MVEKEVQRKSSKLIAFLEAIKFSCIAIWILSFELWKGRKKANGEDVACRSRFLYKHDIEPNLYIVQKDECALGEHSCHENALCTDTSAGYQCACKSGYEGDGKICNDVNECATGVHDCDDNATCKNIKGSFECSCNPNFSGDGKECIAKDCLSIVYYRLYIMINREVWNSIKFSKLIIAVCFNASKIIQYEVMGVAHIWYIGSLWWFIILKDT